MVSDLLRLFLELRPQVLILVLMEYGLWLRCTRTGGILSEVLILVLMEYGLWLIMKKVIRSVREVLILVLMEYGLWLAGLWRARN